MTKEQILDRIDLLRDVFAWSLEKNRGLTPGMRICLSQERAALMHCLNELEEDNSFKGSPSYCIPTYLDERVRHIAGVIAVTKWEKPIINF